jgi:hypothetical protein
VARSSPPIVGTPSSLAAVTQEGMCATDIERDEHFELQVLEESLDCALSWHCRDHVPFLLESSLEVSILAAEEIVEHIPCGPCRKEIYPYLDWVDRYMMYMDTPWDIGSVIISRLLMRSPMPSLPPRRSRRRNQKIQRRQSASSIPRSR